MLGLVPVHEIHDENEKEMEMEMQKKQQKRERNWSLSRTDGQVDV